MKKERDEYYVCNVCTYLRKKFLSIPVFPLMKIIRELIEEV